MATRRSERCSNGENKSDVYVQKRETVEIVDSDLSNSQVKNDGEDSDFHVVERHPAGNIGNRQMKGDGEGSDVHVKEEEPLEFEDSDTGNRQKKGNGADSIDVHVLEK